MRRQLALPLLLGAGLLALGVYVEPASAQIGRAVNKATRRPAARPKTRNTQGILPGNPRPNPRGQAGNVNVLIERLVLMPTAQRNDFLDTNARFKHLPKKQQQRIRQRLKQVDEMPAHQRESLIKRYRYFHSLPPSDQRQARRDYAEWGKLSRARRLALSAESRRLLRASPKRREARLNSEGFATAYSPAERRMIELFLAIQGIEP